MSATLSAIDVPPGAPLPTEYVRSLQPFVVRRRVIWGECDPAGVVYTPRFADYSAAANMLFLAHVLDASGAGNLTEGKRAHGIGTPCKALSCVFHTSLRPDEWFDMRVVVSHIGNSTFELTTHGTDLQGQPVFEGKNTIITIAHRDETAMRRAVRVPDSVRRALQPWLVAVV